MSTNTTFEEQIEQQRKLVFAENPTLKIVAPCAIGNGILQLSKNDIQQFVDFFRQLGKNICFFFF